MCEAREASAACLGGGSPFYGGADLDFQKKGNFYKSHHFDEIRGKEKLLSLMKDKKNLNSWGLNDDTLLNLVYQRYLKLSETKEKFGLFLITLGTHHPKGHIPPEYRDIKYKDGDNPILNAIKVTDVLITDFVKKIINSKYFQDTVIVIASDHLAMRNTAFETLKKGRRRNLFMIIAPENEQAKQISKRGSTLDIGPTIMSFLG